ncbi:MAG: response regulator transcription factor [Elusimicrobiota bacterium]|nr:MAG: response regulator transcription factor [Elusimicrobiota bacterium]
MAPTLLIVEDEQDISYVLKANFKKEGYNVLTAPSAEAGLKLARAHKPDIFILDITLPKMDGLELMQKLREETAAPVLFLTAKRDEIDRIVGLKLGADDYITKPFSIRELSLRVKAILRHMTGRPAAGKEKTTKLGDIEIDFERHEVKVHGASVSLAPKEFQILKLLVEADGKILSRDQLAQHLWGPEQGLEMDIRIVDQHIARLRKKLMTERDRIATVSNFGYQIKNPERVPVAAGAGRSAKKSR